MIHPNLSNFIFSSYLLILKVSSVKCEWLKLNFSVLVREGSLYFDIPKFCRTPGNTYFALIALL